MNTDTQRLTNIRERYCKDPRLLVEDLKKLKVLLHIKASKALKSEQDKIGQFNYWTSIADGVDAAIGISTGQNRLSDFSSRD